MKLFKAGDLIADQLLHQHLIVGGLPLDPRQALPHTQAAQLHILRGDQVILVKKGNLDAAAADVQDGGSLFDNLLECIALGGDSLVSQKTLLRVAQNIDPDTGALINGFQHDHGIGRLPDGAGAESPVIAHLIALHDFRKVFHDGAQLVDQLRRNPACGIGGLAQLQAMGHPVNGMNAVSSGKLKDLQTDVVRSDLDRGKHCHLHTYPPIYSSLGSFPSR